MQISAERVARLLTVCDDVTLPTTDRGRALEDLAVYVFEKIPGLSATMRNDLSTFLSEEIDVALWNDRHPRGLHNISFPDIVLVECKNWQESVGSMHVAWFDNKLRARSLALGILLAMNGVTGDANERTRAHDIVARALHEGRHIIVLTREDIAGITESDQLVALLKTRLTQLVVRGAKLTLSTGVWARSAESANSHRYRRVRRLRSDLTNGIVHGGVDVFVRRQSRSAS